MLTLPVTLPAPEVLVRAPPLKVRSPLTVSGFVPLARDPPAIVRVAVVTWESWDKVPETMTAAKLCPVPRLILLADPVKVTVDEVAVNPAAEEVSHDPAMLIVAEANVAVDAPEDVRFPLNVVVEEVSVRAPANVRLPLNVVEIPLLTVRLFTVWGTSTVPPDVPTTIVEVPAANPPALVSMERTVIVEPFALSAPPAPTVRPTAATERFDADVDSVVVPAPPCTVRTFATRNAFAAIVNVTVVAPLLKVAL